MTRSREDHRLGDHHVPPPGSHASWVCTGVAQPCVHRSGECCSQTPCLAAAPSVPRSPRPLRTEHRSIPIPLPHRARSRTAPGGAAGSQQGALPCRAAAGGRPPPPSPPSPNLCRLLPNSFPLSPNLFPTSPKSSISLNLFPFPQFFPLSPTLPEVLFPSPQFFPLSTDLFSSLPLRSPSPNFLPPKIKSLP